MASGLVVAESMILAPTSVNKVSTATHTPEGKGEMISGDEKGTFHEVLEKEVDRVKEKDVRGKTGTASKVAKGKDEVSSAETGEKKKASGKNLRDVMAYFLQLIQKGRISLSELKEWFSENILQDDKVLQEFEKALRKLVQEMEARVSKGVSVKEMEVSSAQLQEGSIQGSSEEAKKEVAKTLNELSRIFKEKVEPPTKDGFELTMKEDPSFPVATASEEKGEFFQSLFEKGMGKLFGNGEVSQNDAVGINSSGSGIREEVEKAMMKGNQGSLGKELSSYGSLTTGVERHPVESVNVASDGGIKPSSVVDQIVQAVKFFQKDGQYTVRVALNPPELGNVDVSVSVRGHHVQAIFLVDNSTTHKLLTGQLTELQAILNRQGLIVHDVSVQVGGGNPQGFHDFSNGSWNSMAHTWSRGDDSVKKEPVAMDVLSPMVETVGIPRLSRNPWERINLFA